MKFKWLGNPKDSHSGVITFDDGRKQPVTIRVMEGDSWYASASVRLSFVINRKTLLAEYENEQFKRSEDCGSCTGEGCDGCPVIEKQEDINRINELNWRKKL